MVLNQVYLQYDDLGRLVKDYQEHEGAKDGDTLYVEYNYPDFATSGLRLESFRYPNGRKTHFDYSSPHGTALNRLDAIKDDNAGSPGDTLAEYTWLGLGTMVVEDFTQPQVKLDYFGGASGTYAGFDRVIDQKWYDYGAAAVRDQYTYGHDRASNRLYRENTGPSGKDEYYTYDGLYRLVNFDRGDLNANKDAISGTPAREQDFTLDATGNWADFLIKTSGSTDLSQSRTHNPVNELTDITETQGTAWATPAHDRAGNMTTVPKPSDLANGLTCTYDAWNRLVEVEDAAAEVTVARYEYDGLGRRIKKHLDSQSPDSPDGIDAYEHYFYAGVQVVETRETDTENDQPENLQPVYQCVWSERYIDAPILRDENTDADSLCDDARLYYLTDANFNVTTLVDTAGDAIERYIYDPYGHVTIYDAAWTNARSASTYANSALYTGREYDLETGLYYYRARYYSAEIGRFAGRDPIGVRRASANLYCYGANQPTAFTDPAGLWMPDEHEKLTQQSFIRAFLCGLEGEGTDGPCSAYVLKWLKAANVAQDDVIGVALAKARRKPVDPNSPSEKYERHFCRHPGEEKRGAITNYRKYLQSESDEFQRHLTKAKANSREAKDACYKALDALGRLSHSWQDFYGHAVGPRGAEGGFSSSPFRSPDDLWVPLPAPKCDYEEWQQKGFIGINPLWPPAYPDPNEHPEGAEPRMSAAEKARRWELATDFVSWKFSGYLNQWYSACYCWCPRSR